MVVVRHRVERPEREVERRHRDREPVQLAPFGEVPGEQDHGDARQNEGKVDGDLATDRDAGTAGPGDARRDQQDDGRQRGDDADDRERHLEAGRAREVVVAGDTTQARSWGAHQPPHGGDLRR